MKDGIDNKGRITIPSSLKQLIRELENYNRSKTRNINLADALLLAYYQGTEVTLPAETPSRIGPIKDVDGNILPNPLNDPTLENTPKKEGHNIFVVGRPKD